MPISEPHGNGKTLGEKKSKVGYFEQVQLDMSAGTMQCTRFVYGYGDMTEYCRIDLQIPGCSITY